MFELDICKCGNAEKCPNKDICLRGRKETKPGIYTVSLFYDEKNKECEYFIPVAADQP